MKRDRSEIALQWSETIKKQMLSDKPAATWCRENNISYQTFLYWRKRLCPPSKPKQQISRTQFTELSQSNWDSWFRISCRGVRLVISKNFDREALQCCLKLFGGI